MGYGDRGKELRDSIFTQFVALSAPGRGPMGHFDDLPGVRLHGIFTGSSRDWSKFLMESEYRFYGRA